MKERPVLNSLAQCKQRHLSTIDPVYGLLSPFWKNSMTLMGYRLLPRCGSISDEPTGSNSKQHRQLRVTRTFSKNFMNASLGRFNVLTTPRTSSFQTRVLRRSEWLKSTVSFSCTECGTKGARKESKHRDGHDILLGSHSSKTLAGIVGVTIVYTHNHKSPKQIRQALKRVGTFEIQGMRAFFSADMPTYGKSRSSDISPGPKHCP